MKKRTRILTTALLLCVSVVMSCEKDNKQGLDYSINDAAYFIGNFVSTNLDGTISVRLTGYCLNEADDTEISIPAESWEEAVKLFKSWLPDNASCTENESSITWGMSDSEGKSQGSVVLTKKTGGLVAEAVVPSEIPYVHTIRFIPKASWPENSYGGIFAGDWDTVDILDAYFLGNVVLIDVPSHHGTGKFMIVREYDQKKNEKGILVNIQNKSYNFWIDNTDGVVKRSRSTTDIKAASRAYIENKADLDPLMADAGFGPRTANMYCWEWSDSFFFGGKQDKRVKFYTAEVTSLNPFYPNANEIQMYYFWMEEKDGKLQLMID